MTPTIVLKNGRPFLVTGSPGGSRIITAVLGVILNVIDLDLPIAEAVAAPRIHHQWSPDEVAVERGFPAEAKTIASVGPAGRSMAQSLLTSCLAAVTKRLPGPKIFSTRATRFVP